MPVQKLWADTSIRHRKRSPEPLTSLRTSQLPKSCRERSISRRETIEAARTFFQQAIDDDPALGGAYVGMAVVLIHEQRFKTALPLLDRAEGLRPAPGSYILRRPGLNSNSEIPTLPLGRQSLPSESRALTHKKDPACRTYEPWCLFICTMWETARRHLVEAIARDRGGQYAALANLEMDRLQPLQAARR